MWSRCRRTRAWPPLNGCGRPRWCSGPARWWALPARLAAVSFGDLGAHWAIAVNLLAGSLLGAWAGASWAVRMRSATFYKVLAVLMVAMAAALVVTRTTAVGSLDLPGPVQVVAGVVAGFGIGVVAAIMGVAERGAADPHDRAAVRNGHQARGNLSLLVSLPTMLVAFARYSRDGSFAALMATGSISRRAPRWVPAGRDSGPGPDPCTRGDAAGLGGQGRPAQLTQANLTTLSAGRHPTRWRPALSRAPGPARPPRPGPGRGEAWRAAPGL